MSGYLRFDNMNKSLNNLLEKLKQKDINTRKNLVESGKLYGSYEAEMQHVHTENALALSDIVDQYGWPGISKVGLEGCRAAWLVAQHSICTPDLQKKFLQHLIEAEKEGDVPAKQVAWLTDRIRFNQGKAQIYGTVLDWDEKGELGCEVENPDTLDELRDSVGLPPFKESIEKEQRAIEKEQGKPPTDYKAYKQAGVAWAKNVGWR